MKQRAKIKINNFWKSNTGHWHAGGKIIDHPKVGTTDDDGSTSRIERLDFEKGELETKNTIFEIVK